MVFSKLSAQIDPHISAAHLGRVFIKALQTKDAILAESLLPSDSETFRKIATKETEGKSSNELAEMIQRVKIRLKSKFENILYEADKDKIDLDKIIYKSADTEVLPFPEAILFGMNLNYKYQSDEGAFVLIVVNLEDKWYLLEIAKSADVFTNSEE